MITRPLVLSGSLALLLITAAAVGQQPFQPGSPLIGLSSQDLELFRAGREDFMEVESADDGLGPMFNGTSCAQCHNIPTVGGTGTMVEMRAGYRDENGRFHSPPGGTVMHLFSVPPHNCQVTVYDEANVIAHRISMPLFGAGLVEAIPDAAILAQADPDDANGDGISGRAAMVVDAASGERRVGRFGWKGQHATLLAFAADAYLNEMGITNDLFATEAYLNVPAEKVPDACRPSQKMEDVRNRITGRRGIDNFENYLRFLAPPARAVMSGAAVRGEGLFAAVGCAACHTPTLTTGKSTRTSLHEKRVELYSDLLLHDVGTGDGIEQGEATGDEFRTPSLWGLRFRRPLLHDGSASTIEHAIERHSGEATSSKERFDNLDRSARQDIIAFLKSL